MSFNNSELTKFTKNCITSKGLKIIIRPVIDSDLQMMDDFFYSLSDESLNKRFLARKKYLPHRRIKDFIIYSEESKIFIVATVKRKKSEKIIGLGQYWIIQNTRYADVAFVIADDYHRKGICEELLVHLSHIAKFYNLRGFMAEVLKSNRAMRNLFEKNGFHLSNQPNDSDDMLVYYKLKF
jgi:RimJ/RimL family protein N-acetyltransferase